MSGAQVVRVDPAAVPRRLLDGLDGDQRRAVLSVNGPVLVVAGPGSGKTAVLTRRAAAVHLAGVPASQVCAVTFTNKAADEMRERITDFVGPHAAEQMTVSTFHSMCVRILRQWGGQVGLPAGFAIASTGDVSRLFHETALSLGLLKGLSTTQGNDVVSTAMRRISAAKNAGHSHPSQVTLDSQVSQLWVAVRLRMAERALVDFDDLLTKVWELRDVPPAREWLSRRFARVMVDEFQDTNVVQQNIVSLLAADGEVFAVGDADQSIYAFRGASGAVADMFTRDFPDHQVVVLGSNYRSTVTICAVSQAVIAANPAQHRSPMRAVSGVVGTKVGLLVAADEEDEATEVARQVANSAGSCAVLVRANQQTRAFERAFALAGLPCAVVGTVRFVDRAEVRDVLAWLRVVANPHDVEAFRRAVGVPRRGVGDVTAGAVIQYAQSQGVGVVDACRALLSAGQVKGRQGDGLRDFVRVVGVARRANSAGSAVGVVRAVLDDCGVGRSLGGSGDDERHTERVANIDQVLLAAAQLDGVLASSTSSLLSSPGGVAGLLCEQLMLSTDSAASGGGERVVISTMHAAKGKEFDNVWVAGAEEGIIPHARSRPEDTAEERRLFFVAVSRAKSQLTVSRCVSRWVPGSSRAEMKPTRFLADIPQHLSEVVFTDAAREGTGAPAQGGGGMRGVSRAAARTGVRSGGQNSAVGVGNSGGGVKGSRRLRFVCGQAVTHSKFGDAVVVEVSQVSVRARFGDGTERTFVPDGVHLRPL